MNSSNRKVFVLDDSEDLLALMKIYSLKLCGCVTLTARSFRETESLGEELFQCQLAILDINLGPEQPSGLDVYRWMRAKGFTRPIYFLTGHARSCPQVAEAELIGGVKILNKPISPLELSRIVLESTCSHQVPRA